MMPPALPLTRDLVLIGGGHTHALVLRMWGMAPLPGVRVTLINPGPTAPYSGMLPGFVAGHYDRDALDIDLVKLARFAGARVILGAAQGIDTTARQIHVAGRPPVSFDVASVDIGITSEMPGLPGFADHAVPAKPLGPFATKWARYRDGKGPARVAVIGGGVAGARARCRHGLCARAQGPRGAGASRRPGRRALDAAGARRRETARRALRSRRQPA
ncbi:NADH dehydrogenase-like protein / Selenide,water dikinase [Salipiger profundus]|uniref:NADH dehydrogenase-like protein / Selenide,water dikinase n=1 Tax=Salipiger profundus TaxID=1229727 RepID=A0A1U7D0R0_9RHOB|nr:NADH dehydrogenase-like protein / Selenide,water dikinase [Salipiger profundus]